MYLCVYMYVTNRYLYISTHTHTNIQTHTHTHSSMLLVCKSLVIFMHRHTSTLTHNAPHTDAGILELCREITTLVIATECTTSQLCCPLHDVECHAGANVILGGCLAVLDLCCRDKARCRVSLISPYSGRFP